MESEDKCAGPEENNVSRSSMQLQSRLDEISLLEGGELFAGSLVRICDLKTNTDLNGKRNTACSDASGSTSISIPFSVQEVEQDATYRSIRSGRPHGNSARELWKSDQTPHRRWGRHIQGSSDCSQAREYYYARR